MGIGVPGRAVRRKILRVPGAAVIVASCSPQSTPSTTSTVPSTTPSSPVTTTTTASTTVPEPTVEFEPLVVWLIGDVHSPELLLTDPLGEELLRIPFDRRVRPEIGLASLPTLVADLEGGWLLAGGMDEGSLPDGAILWLANAATEAQILSVSGDYHNLISQAAIRYQDEPLRDAN